MASDGTAFTIGLAAYQEQMDDSLCTWPTKPTLHTRANAVDQWPKPITPLTQDLIMLPQERALESAFAEELGVAQPKGPWAWNGVFYGWVTYSPSPVMVWTADQTGFFLDFIHNDRLYPLYHLTAYRGPRRGEVCGLRWVDRSKTAKALKITEQLVQYGWKVEAGEPKSEAGGRWLVLDDGTDKELEAWRKRQIAERLAYGPGYINSGRIFTHQDGSELHPAEVTKHFNQLIAASGLPPIRLHDLRHGSAALALEAGVDIKVVQEDLGHSSSVLTRDTYTSVSPRLAKAEAERTAAMVPRARSTPSDDKATGTDGLPLVPHGRQKDLGRLTDSDERQGQYGCAARDLNPQPAD